MLAEFKQAKPGLCSDLPYRNLGYVWVLIIRIRVTSWREMQTVKRSSNVVVNLLLDFRVIADEFASSLSPLIIFLVHNTE